MEYFVAGLLVVLIVILIYVVLDIQRHNTRLCTDIDTRLAGMSSQLLETTGRNVQEKLGEVMLKSSQRKCYPGIL